MNAQSAKATNVQQVFEQALTFHHQGRLADADKLYGAVLLAQPGHFDALQMRGVIQLAAGNCSEALRLVGSALRSRPNSPQALINYGMVLEAMQRFEEALASFDAAIGYKSKYAEAHNNRGSVLMTLAREEEALESFRRAVKIKPDYPEALANLGNALRVLEQPAEALKAVDRALALRPNFALGQTNRGTILEALNENDKALECYERALKLNPNDADALNNRGRILRGKKQYADALACIDRALVLKPNLAAAYFNRGSIFTDLNRHREATESYDKAAAAGGTLLAEAKFAACISELPTIFHDEDEIATQRAAYERRLRKLHAEVAAMADPGKLIKGVGASLPFYLAYQGQNDRELQTLFGETVCRIAAAHFPVPAMPQPPASGEPVRVGIVSGFFRLHSNWKIPIKGWLSQLDRQRFKVFGYSTGVEHDAESDVAAAMCDRFVKGPLTIEAWRKEIAADAPHVLIFPEVGMDKSAGNLAAQRLAPVQCNSWGHPDTSGFPTLDYYFSSDLMEPAGAQDHYSERLVRLPNLSIYYEPTPVSSEPITRGELGLREDATAFWCGQSIYKYLPQHDDVFPRIAREVPGCQFAFLQYQGAQAVTDIFRARLAKAFAAHGLSAEDHCVFIPRMSQLKYAAAVGLCDVVLDSIGWSGCNSTLEGLSQHVPVVTMQGTTMRGRHSAAIFQMMDVTDAIASSIDDYVSIATRLAKDPDWRTSLREKIAANKHKVYRDRACIEALEEFLDRVAREPRV